VLNFLDFFEIPLVLLLVLMVNTNAVA